MTGKAFTMRKVTATLVATMVAFPAMSADLNFEERFAGAKPAVDGFNGKVSLQYSYFNVDGADAHANIYGGEASFSVPLGQRFGAQFDFGASIIDIPGLPSEVSVTMLGAGGHLFWRNPDVALLGVYADVNQLKLSDGTDSLSVSFYRAGAEAEVYIDRFSLEGFAGMQWADGGDTSVFTGDLTAAFYPIDDLRFDASIIRNFDITYGRVGVEYQADFNGFRPTMFANATFGDGFQNYKAGLRFYFGGSEQKSLIRRHREDDPRSRILDFSGLGGLELDNDDPEDDDMIDGPIDTIDDTEVLL